MMPRYQKILFAVLFVASVAMTAALVRLRERAHDQMLRGGVEMGTTAPATAPAETVTLMVADDETSTLRAQSMAFPLPEAPEARARTVLNRLLGQYAGPQSLHPLPPVADAANAVDAVYLMPVRDAAPKAAATKPAAAGKADKQSTAALSAPTSAAASADQIAIVDLTQAFAAAHPSGLETETLTVLSICATLHANLPQVTEVRFLVGGQQQATLHGHADLTQTYLTAASAAASAPSSSAGSSTATSPDQQ